jgi:hypothetical protein
MSFYQRVKSLGRKRPGFSARNPSFEGSLTPPEPVPIDVAPEEPEAQPKEPEVMVPPPTPTPEELDPDLECPVNEEGATRQARSRTDRGDPVPVRVRAIRGEQTRHASFIRGGTAAHHSRTQSAQPFSHSRGRAMTATGGGGAMPVGGRALARSFYGNTSESGGSSVGGSELYSAWDPSSGLAPMPRPVADSSAAENTIVPYFPGPEETPVEELEEELQKRARRRSSRKLVPLKSAASLVSDGEDDEEDEDSCLICMGAFSETQKRNVRIVNPCSKKCNDSPVHPRCIYEWKERKNADKKNSASCPLCRGPLDDIVYTPPDRLRTWTLKLLEPRKAFVVRPIPRSEGMVRCYVKVMNAGTWLQPTITYEMWMQAPSGRSYPHGPMPAKKGEPDKGDILLMTARKRLSNFGAARLDITLDPECLDLDKTSPSYLGTVVSSFSGLEHTLVAPYRRPKADGTVSNSGTKELVSVVYGQNRVGLGVGPRKMKLAMPQVRRDPVGSRVVRSVVESEIKKYMADHPEEEFPDLDECDDEEMDEKDDDETNPNVNLDPIAKTGGGRAAVEPVVVEDSQSTKSNATTVGDTRYLYTAGIHRPARRSETMVALLLKKKDNDKKYNKGVVYSTNKEPKWLDLIQAYSLDFQGRVTKPSNKNFQLTMKGVHGTALQFGKIATKEETESPVTAIYSLDFQFPWSPLQALGVALSSSDRKLACA